MTARTFFKAFPARLLAGLVLAFLTVVLLPGPQAWAESSAWQALQEDMPVLKRFMDQLSVLPAAVIMLGLLLVVWLDNYLSRERKRSMMLIIALVFGLILQGKAHDFCFP